MREGTFSASYVNTLITTALALGVNRAELLQAASLTDAELSMPSKRITMCKVATLFHVAKALSCRPGFGLSVGKHITPSSFGVHGYMLMSCKNVAEVIELLPTYEKIVTDIATCHSKPLNNEFKVSWRTEIKDLDFKLNISEAILSGWHFFGRSLTANSMTFKEVCFEHERPKYFAKYETLFQCPVKFNQAESSVLVPRSYLEFPVKQYDPELQGLMKEKAKILLQKIESNGHCSQQVEHYLHNNLAYLQPSILQVAEAMNMSERTLRRRLKEENTTFKALLNNCRKDEAKLYLEDMSLSLTEVANLLGYESQGSFTQACKGWFEVTPSQLRKNL